MTWPERTSVVGGFCIGAAAFMTLISVVVGVVMASGGAWFFGFVLIALMPSVLALLIIGTIMLVVARHGWVDRNGRFTLLMLGAAASLGLLAVAPLQLQPLVVLRGTFILLMPVAVIVTLLGIIALFARGEPPPSD